MNIKNETGNLLKQIFEDNWEKIFIFDAIHDKHITYGDFFNRVMDFKEKLEQEGLKKGNFLCLILDNSIELAIFYFSSLLLGLVAIPIDPYRGSDEIKEILNQFNNKKIICDEKFVNDFPSSIKLDKLIENKKKFGFFDSLAIFKNVDFEKTFLITFTSGTSGKQKGVMHSFNNLFQSANAFGKRFDFGNGDIFLHNLPMTYMAGILNLLILPLISKSQIVITERTSVSNISKFWNIAIKFSANVFWLIPTMLELLIKLDRGTDGINYTKNNKITICVGTSSLNSTTKEYFEKKYNIEVFESYGLSETLFVSTNFLGNNKKSSVGKLLEKVDLNFLNAEICIKVPWMFSGYYNLDKQNFFKDDFYLSGDLGNIDGDFLYIVGRNKDIIIKGGINISPRTIEEIINKTNIFSEIVILGFPSRLFGEKIICFGVLEKIITETEKKSLNKQIIAKLGINYSIDEFVFVKELPKNLNGKIDKLKIRQIFGQKINDS